MRLTLTEDEKRRILGLHGSNLIVEQGNPKVTQIQTYLKGKGYDLGTSGANKDGIDGQWGGLTSSAVKTEFKVDLDDKGNIKAVDAPATTGSTTGDATTTTPDQKMDTLKPTSVQSTTQQTQLQGTAATQPAGTTEPRTRG